VPASAQRLAAREVFPGLPGSVGLARRFLASVLGQDSPVLDDVLLLVSEVASNAVRHTASGNGGRFEVAVMLAVKNRVRVEVGDQGGASEPRPADSGDGLAVVSGGRGLRIVEALADRWGCDGDELGRVVWFEIGAKYDRREVTG